MSGIIHILFDQKFIDEAAVRFEGVAPGVSRYIIPGNSRTLTLVKKTPVEFLPESEVSRLVSDKSCKAVIFHALTPCRAKILSSIHSNARVAWMGWGYDYYDALLSNCFPDGLLLSSTKRLDDQIQMSQRRSSWRRLLSRLKSRIVNDFPTAHLDYSRINYFCPVLEIEHEMAVKENPLFRAEYFPWNYQSIVAEANESLARTQTTGPDVLVGNSATPTNNHLEIFDWLANCGRLGDRRIIVPLNYGSRDYGEAVSRRGRELFGDQFVPLLEWMALDEYFVLLRSCRIAVFGHLRQQAVGNVIQMMKQGSRIYLFEANPLFQSLTARGASLGKIDNLRRARVAPDFAPLSEEDYLVNAKVADQHVEYAPAFPRTRRLVETLLNHY